MATAIVKSIGTTGRDYSTVQAFEDAIPANLQTTDESWTGECYNDGGAALGIVDFSAHATDATRFIRLTAAAGHSFMDNANVRTTALTYASGTYASLRSTASYVFCVTFSGAVHFITIDRLMMQTTHAQSAPIGTTVVGNNQTFKNLILHSAHGTGPLYEIFGTSTKIINCVFIHNSGSGNGVLLRDTVRMIACTLIRTTNNTATASGVIARSYAVIRLDNTAIFGYTTGTGTSGTGAFSASSSNNATTAASGLPGSNNQHSVTYSATTPFVQASNTGTDARAITGTALAGAGVLDSTNAPSDISGTARTATPTIGAWELATAAAGGTRVDGGSVRGHLRRSLVA